MGLEGYKMSAVSRFFRNVKSEMSKVTWPTGKELRTYTITVIIAVACMAVFFMVVDFLIEMLIQFML